MKKTILIIAVILVILALIYFQYEQKVKAEKESNSGAGTTMKPNSNMMIRDTDLPGVTTLDDLASARRGVFTTDAAIYKGLTSTVNVVGALGEAGNDVIQVIGTILNPLSLFFKKKKKK